MKCRTEGCEEELVSYKYQTKTLVGYSSPEGHDHDDNCLTRNYQCANGHENRLSVIVKCPTEGCTWVGSITCFCSGPKLDKWPELSSPEKAKSDV